MSYLLLPIVAAAIAGIAVFVLLRARTVRATMWHGIRVRHKDKKKIIEAALKALENNEGFGMCHALVKGIKDVTGQYPDSERSGALRELFPEFTRENYQRMSGITCDSAMFHWDSFTVEGRKNRISFLKWMLGKY